MAEQPKPGDGNEGEGNRTADRAYREGLRRFAEEHDPEALAREAQRDVEADEEGYREAEAAGKAHIAEEDPEVRKEGKH
ncbi:MAG TPA: hypothetical protein VH877_24205 [Polyangia bacterium]|jgi:hypothetical protein|nr:hypothetical protein [Polyangia bacterium]